MSYNQSSSSHTDDGDGTWINWFVGLHGNEFLCRLPPDYAQDKFNLTGLETMVPNFLQALDTILDQNFGPQPMDDAESAAHLFGLIHARYIVTARGIDDMCVKYERGDFGMCPRVYCNGQHVLPVGLTDQCGESHVKVYCPRCHDIFQPRSRCALLDGAMFGTGFPHMFLLQLPNLRPEPPLEKYTPRLYGFKLHNLALLPESEHQDAPLKPKLAKTEVNTSALAAKTVLVPATRRNNQRVNFI